MPEHRPVVIEGALGQLIAETFQQLSLRPQPAGSVFASPATTTSGPTFRPLVVSDLPIGQAQLVQTELDFGTVGVKQKTFTIALADLTAASCVLAQLAYVQPTGKDLDELEFDLFDFRAVAAVGSLTLHARALEGSVAGCFYVNLLYNPL
jgi:hypothetical protein